MLISSIRLAAKLRACLVNAVTGKVKMIPQNHFSGEATYQACRRKSAPSDLALQLAGLVYSL